MSRRFRKNFTREPLLSFDVMQMSADLLLRGRVRYCEIFAEWLSARGDRIDVKLSRLLRPLPWAAGVWACYWIALFISTHVPKLPRMGPASGGDKIAHFVGYAVLAFLTCAVLLRRSRWSRGTAAAILAALMAYGVVDELLQIPIPNRSADLLDWVCDAVGAAAGILTFRVVQRTLAWRSELRRERNLAWELNS